MLYSLRRFIIITFLLAFSTSAFCQNDPVPEYLIAQPFPDSVQNVGIVTYDGKRISFSEMISGYKGKKVVIDMWASWCRDCIVGLPKLNELRRKTGEEHVVYLFLSVDANEEKWKNAISRFNIRGEHYRVEGAWKTPLSNYIALDWVPRYIVLSETGMIIMPKAIEASQINPKDLIVNE
jgi:thiol-disulfide isomerase/thioredoxin